MSTTFPISQNNPAGAIPAYLTAQAQGGATPYNVAATGSAIVKTGAGTLFGLSVNTAAAGDSVSLYDGTTAVGTLIGTFALTAVGGPVLPAVGIKFATGLFYQTTGATAPNFTIYYV